MKLLPVCPEVEIGLGTPREPIRLIRRENVTALLQPSTGARITGKIRAFAKDYLAGIFAADGFILKSCSPSCGIRDTKVFPDAHSDHHIGKGAGLFAEAVLAKFGHLAIEDEARLTNPAIKEHILTRLFTLAAFRALKKSPTRENLPNFTAHTSPFSRPTTLNQQPPSPRLPSAPPQSKSACPPTRPDSDSPSPAPSHGYEAGGGFLTPRLCSQASRSSLEATHSEPTLAPPPDE